MGLIARLILVAVLGCIPAAVFAYFMLLPGLSEFTTYPTGVMVAYAGCALGAALMGPLGLVFAALSKSGRRTAAAPPAAADEMDSADDIDEFDDSQGDDSQGDGFGDDGAPSDEFSDGEFDSGEFSDDDFSDESGEFDDFDAFEDNR